MPHMPKKTTILIIILAIITSILIFVAIRTENSTTTEKKDITQKTITEAPSMAPYASLSFSPATLNASQGASTPTVDIMLDTKGQMVSGAQVELLYDPEVITNVSLTPLVDGQLFGKNPFVLINTIDKEQGRITYAVAMDVNDTEKIGNAPIGRLTLTINRFTKKTTSSITFLPKSTVTTLKSLSTVLANTTPFEIILATPTQGTNE